MTIDQMGQKTISRYCPFNDIGQKIAPSRSLAISESTLFKRGALKVYSSTPKHSGDRSCEKSLDFWQKGYAKSSRSEFEDI